MATSLWTEPAVTLAVVGDNDDGYTLYNSRVTLELLSIPASSPPMTRLGQNPPEPPNQATWSNGLPASNTTPVLTIEGISTFTLIALRRLTWLARQLPSFDASRPDTIDLICGSPSRDRCPCSRFVRSFCVHHTGSRRPSTKSSSRGEEATIRQSPHSVETPGRAGN